MAAIEPTLEFGNTTLTVEPGRWLVAFKAPEDRTRALRALTRGPVRADEDPVGAEGPHVAVNRGARMLWLRGPAAQALGTRVLAGLRPLWITPVYRVPGTLGDRGLLAARPDRVYVRPSKSPGALVVINTLAKRAGWRTVDVPGNIIAPWLRLAPTSSSTMAAPELARTLATKANLAVKATYLDYIPRTAPIASPSNPNDWLYQLGWQHNLAVINAPAGWTDYGATTKAVRVAIIDKGIDIDHGDLRANLASKGGQYGCLVSDTATGGGLVAASWMHGTALAGVTAAVTDNDDPGDDSTKTMAGLARNCSIVSLACDTGDAGDVQNGIGLAVSGDWASDVILLGLVSDGWLSSGTDPNSTPLATAISNAIAAGKVVVAPAGNMLKNTYDPTDPVRPVYPACVTGVVAVGASSSPDTSLIDQRKLSSGDSDDITTEGWASRYGAGLSVVAPGTGLLTTDNHGADGRNTGSGYDGALGSDYVSDFGGTSAAAAQVAGLAALVLSRHDGWLPTGAARVAQVRRVIERCAVRINTVSPTYTYTEGASQPNGPWNEEVGHGRIDVHRSLDLADVYIRDGAADDGTEPSSGYFWEYSDIAVRIVAEDYPTVAGAFAGWQADVANPPTGVADDRDSWIYVCVRNLGPATATNVRVRASLASCATGFRYPYDWWHDTSDNLHLPAAPQATGWTSAPSGHSDDGQWYKIGDLPANAVAYARFKVSGADVTTARDTWHWGAHICSLAVVMADNDYPFNDFQAPLALTDVYTGEQPQRNNIAQRNLSVVHPGSPWRVAFLAGSFGDPGTTLDLIVDSRSLPPGTKARLHLDADVRVLPRLDAATRGRTATAAAAAMDPRSADASDGVGLVILDRTRVHAVFGDRDALLTLEPGSRLDLRRRTGTEATARGGRVVLEAGRRVVDLEPAESHVQVKHRPHEAVPILLEIPVPPNLPANARYRVPIVQRNANGTVIGGITFLLAP
jgi:subtilisin family serine protease